MKKKIVYFNTEDQTDLIIEQQMVNSEEFELLLFNDRDDSEMGDICQDADGVVSIYSTLDEKTISKMSKCRCIVLQAIGFNNVDLKAATNHAIAVANVPDYCLQEVAAHTTALALSCIRQIPQLSERVKNHIWDYRGKTMRRLSTMTYGLIAFGNIAKNMVPMLKGLGMRVIAYDSMARNEDFENLGVERIENINDLLKEADVISIHVPLNEHTKNFMHKDKFSKMKNSAYFINTSRGGVVDEKALYDALTSGQIAGAALDVLVDEKECSSPLIGLENVIITPHMSFYSEECLVQMRQSALKQVLQVLKEERLPDHLVNKDLKSL